MLIQQFSNRFSRILIVSNQTIFLKFSRSQFYNVCFHILRSPQIFLELVERKDFISSAHSSITRHHAAFEGQSPHHSLLQLRYNLIHIYHISKRQKERREKLLRSQIRSSKFNINRTRHDIRFETNHIL